MTDERTRSTEQLSLPGHDRDCARAMLSQSRLRGDISDIQVEHLLAIGYRAGSARASARFPEVVAEALMAASNTVPGLPLLTRRRVIRWLRKLALTSDPTP